MNICTFTHSRCHIDLGAVARNFKRLGEVNQLMPVIKSDAYGHGLLQTASVLNNCGARYFAVGTVSEGLALRDANFQQDIVILLGALNQDEWQKSYQYQLLPLALTLQDLDKAAAVCTEHKPFNIALACDTGMSRLGFSLEEMPYLIEALRKQPCLNPVLAVSHQACADMPNENAYTQKQEQNFISMTESLRQAFPSMARTLDNSAASLRLPRRYELCRPGISLYGGNPFAGTEWENYGKDFEWAMSVSAPIIQIRRLKKGQSVSYGRIYTAPQEMTIAIIGIGYANGFNRALSNNCDLLIAGQRCKQVGRVCMGMIMADVSCLEQIEGGEKAWILGGQPLPGQKAVTAQELADKLNTISYEILCLMGASNPREYI